MEAGNTLFHFIENGHKGFTKTILEFSELHAFRIDIHRSIQGFLTTYARRRPQKILKRLEDFQEWMGRFHLVIGCWNSRQEWKKAVENLKTQDPRIVKRLLSLNGKDAIEQLEHIFYVSGRDPLIFENLKIKYPSGPKRKFKSMISESFYRFMPAPPPLGENEQPCGSRGRIQMVNKDHKKIEAVKLLKVLSAVRDQQREVSEKMEFKKVFPELLWGDDNESGARFSDRWFEIMKKESYYQPSDFLMVFDHCPFCLSACIKVSFFKSPQWTWAHRCGRAGWIVHCTVCGEILMTRLIVMS
ncbi:MAG: hypothetical protein B6I30_02935 [Desulfobacteraceae bacterium 4572_187]|nr:MAG: hypothetical protein B6I30_02935 [Desulfobacteraceae bacterium 4572_187]